MYVGLPAPCGTAAPPQVLPKEVDELTPEEEDGSRRAYGGREHVPRTVGGSPQRERRADRPGLLAERTVQAPRNVTLLLEDLETLLGRPGQAERTIELVELRPAESTRGDQLPSLPGFSSASGPAGGGSPTPGSTGSGAVDVAGASTWMTDVGA